MKKVIISLSVIAAFGLYVWHARTDQDGGKVAANTTSPQKSAPSTVAVATTTNSAAYKDGSYTGSTADAYYGNIQVRAVISGGKLTDVQFLQYPSDHRESLAINESAMPLLKQEAIQAQTAHVDGVSGATDTSQAFIESLTSALNQAHS
jgi:uncharacterized protein with FMN-binding domain